MISIDRITYMETIRLHLLSIDNFVFNDFVLNFLATFSIMVYLLFLELRIKYQYKKLKYKIRHISMV